MLITVCMIKREPEIKAHYGERTWIDIDDLHVELSNKQYERLCDTMEKAIINTDRTVTATT